MVLSNDKKSIEESHKTKTPSFSLFIGDALFFEQTLTGKGLAGKSRTRACHIEALVHEAATAGVKNINVASL